MDPIICIRDLVNDFGPQRVHDHLNLDVIAGEILGIVGGSGSGKSVLLRSILGLHRPQSGEESSALIARATGASANRLRAIVVAYQQALHDVMRGLAAQFQQRCATST
jgi:ABC-type transporter Mla maintaining outer membrane lipid asymmetry ATPase subunit MlaF